ncbi:hypothetical protein MMC13_001886 [Lambiella insularis]|nr:hypothetical protein [Lambiella insularis]
MTNLYERDLPDDLYERDTYEELFERDLFDHLLERDLYGDVLSERDALPDLYYDSPLGKREPKLVRRFSGVCPYPGARHSAIVARPAANMINTCPVCGGKIKLVNGAWHKL